LVIKKYWKGGSLMAEGAMRSATGTVTVDRKNLYFAAHLLSLQNKRALGLTVPVWIYVQDPLVAKKKRKLGLEEIDVSWEPDLRPGPTSARITVVDYDGDENKLAEPARWDNRAGWHCFVFGPSRNPVRIGKENADTYQFHQVNVWAIIQRILDFYEEAWVLGRPISWGFAGNRIIVVPHAGYCENAFYDRHSKSLQFYYCGTGSEQVFTCLSHDIVAHETGHAILDGIRPYYYENSSIQTAAFHEFIADLTAILSALRNNKVRRVVAETTQGDLRQAEAIWALAEQFGQEVATGTHESGNRYFLRSALNPWTMEDIEGELSPHKCSNVLTGAVFEILIKIVERHLAKNVSEKRKVTPKQALWWAVDRMRAMALQALDYLPPVDVQFIDYARAVLGAHYLSEPKDEEEYGPLMKEVFTDRKLGALEDETQPKRLALQRYDVQRVSSSRAAAYRFLNENRLSLCIPAEHDIVVADLYATDKLARGAARRPREIVIEYVWHEDVKLQGARFGSLQGQRVPLWCGGTLVLDGRGNVLYWVRKPGTRELIRGRGRVPQYRKGEPRRGAKRRTQLLNYVEKLVVHGRLGLADRHATQGVDIWAPAVSSRQVNGMLRLEVTPHLRHERSY
jgi:hypothetical protein